METVNIFIGTLKLKSKNTMAKLDEIKSLLETQSQVIDEISSDLEELKTKVENSGMNTDEEAELVSLIENANAKLRTVADVYTPTPVEPETPVEPTPQEPETPPVIEPNINPNQPVPPVVNPEFPVNPENPTNPDQL